MRDERQTIRWIAAMMLVAAFASGCATSTARVIEVTPRYIRSTKQDSGDMTFSGGNARLNGGMVGTSARNAAGEEFFVRWTSSTVQSVKFQYRLVNQTGAVKEQTVDAADRTWHLFTINPTDFKSGGPVSAWKVSLLDAQGQCVAEKKSVLW